jgi:hypothetical protein
VYELWVDAEAFGDSGFGEASIESVHASPSKLGENTVPVTPEPCPPEWPPPNCVPSLSGEGYDCGCGSGGSGGGGGVCPPGFVPDLETEGRTCVPAPQ